ncbi:MAG: hypothetical protein LBS90_03445, partial [Oscillospiraceae bacterium]|nr:hypothetical protein [Oscillospiraceae bacterium]
DAQSLRWLETNFGAAAELGYPADCAGSPALYMTRADGVVGYVHPAIDSCANFESGGVYYEWSQGGNEAFYALFGVHGYSELAGGGNDGSSGYPLSPKEQLLEYVRADMTAQYGKKYGDLEFELSYYEEIVGSDFRAKFTVMMYILDGSRNPPPRRDYYVEAAVDASGRLDLANASVEYAVNTVGAVSSAEDAARAYYESKSMTDEIVTLLPASFSPYSGAVKDETVYFTVSVKGDPKSHPARIIVLTRDFGGGWEVVHET